MMMQKTLTWSAKLIDFGEARAMGDDDEMTMKGTPLYVAPEVVLSEPYDHRADIWSFGIFLLHLMTYKEGGAKECWKAAPTRGGCLALKW